MAESSSGHRLLVAPSQRVADFVSATYAFDEVVVTPVTVEESIGRWDIHAGPVQAAVAFGRRLPLGRLLQLVPRSVATTAGWATLVNPIARVAVRGVRTVGSAGGGRREWYCATDLRAVTAVVGEFAGRDLGSLAPMDPPTRFGFSSTPRHPSLASVVTFVETSGATSR
jgi:hypothetical protein